jgi:hypothetical protein
MYRRVLQATYKDKEAANSALSNLLSADFRASNLIIAGTDSDEFRFFADPIAYKGPDMFLIYGGIIGGIVGAVMGFFSLPGLPNGPGEYNGAVPMLSSIIVCVMGMVCGEIIGGLVNLENRKYNCRVAEADLKDRMAIAVEVDSPDMRQRAEMILEDTGAESILSKEMALPAVTTKPRRELLTKSA